MMKKRILSVLALSLLISASAIQSASAARPSAPSAPNDPVGYDVSYPQCGKNLPTDHAFAIIGVNGGNAAKANPCLSEQLSWGNRASGSTNQPHLQLYVNTANPGQVINQITTWPKNNLDNNGAEPNNLYGKTCAGKNDLSCSWLYGWNRAQATHQDYFRPSADKAGISSVIDEYMWWLDVETMNTWQTGTESALRRNVAALEGWTSFFESNGARVGLYSTAYQWEQITGNFIDDESNLNALPNWRPSGSTLVNAKTNCTVKSLTPGGFISLTQYIKKNLDHNFSCI